MQKRSLFCAVMAFSCLLTQSKNVYCASAISVPVEARSTADVAKAAAEEIKQRRQNEIYRAEAEKYTISSAAEAERAQVETQAAKLRIDEAREALAKAELAKDNALEENRLAHALAEDSDEQAKAARAQANAAYNEAARVKAAQARQSNVADVKQNVNTAPASVNKPPAINDELLQAEWEYRQLEAESRRLDDARRQNQPATIVAAGNRDDSAEYYARARRMSDSAATLESEAEQARQTAQSKKNDAQNALLNYQNAKQRVADAELVYNDNLAYTARAKDYATQTLAELNRIIDVMENPGGGYYMSAGAKFYNWHADGGVKGYQLAMPLSWGYWSKDFSYGLSTNFVSSHSRTEGETGSYTGLTDTFFLISKRQDNGGKFFFDYSLGVNIPTGKSAMSWGERYARFNEDLVAVEQFGKSWQFIPGLNINWRPNEKDVWTLGTYYIFSNSYDPTSDIPNDTFNPGGEWGSFLRYQHAGSKWQIVAKLLSTSYGRSKISDGSSYRSKNALEYQLTANRKLSETQDLMFYYWPERQNRNNWPFSGDNSLVHYYGSMWSKKLDSKRTFRLSADVMQTSGARYSGIYNYYDFYGNPRYMARDVNGRRKVTFGIGYDYRINNKSSYNIDLQYFTMHDGRTNLGEPEKRYKGFNILFMYNRSL